MTTPTKLREPTFRMILRNGGQGILEIDAVQAGEAVGTFRPLNDGEGEG